MITVRRLWKPIMALAAVTWLAACGSTPAERTSPCACDWRPVTVSGEVLG